MAFGGSDYHEDNIVLACELCNAEKGYLNVNEFRLIVALREGILTEDYAKSLWIFHGETAEDNIWVLRKK